MSEAPAADAPLNRRERRKLEVRNRIIEAAVLLFSKHGFGATKVSSICEHADVAHKTFFNHFPSKEHLLLHIASHYGEDAFELLQTGLQKYGHPREQLDYCLTHTARSLEGVSENYKALLHVHLISGSGSASLQQRRKLQFEELIGQIITDAGKLGLLRPGNSRETYTEMVVGICLSTLLNWSLEQDYPLMAKMKSAIRFLNGAIFIDE